MTKQEHLQIHISLLRDEQVMSDRFLGGDTETFFMALNDVLLELYTVSDFEKLSQKEKMDIYKKDIKEEVDQEYENLMTFGKIQNEILEKTISFLIQEYEKEFNQKFEYAEREIEQKMNFIDWERRIDKIVIENKEDELSF